MILKAKDGYDLYLADSIIDMADVISIVHSSYKTTIKFSEESKKKPMSISSLTKEQHNSLIEQLTEKFIISQTSKTTTAARKLRVVESLQTPCLKEN